MSLTVYFENTFVVAITYQQAQQSQDYHKVFYINGELKKKEYSKNGVIDYVSYFLSSVEQESDGVAIITSAYPNTDFNIVKLEQIGSYNIKNERWYNNFGIFNDFERKLLIDSVGREICEQKIYSDNGNTSVITTKFYHHDFERQCFYDETTGFITFINGNNPETEYLPIDEYLQYHNANFLIDNPYYRNDNFLP